MELTREQRNYYWRREQFMDGFASISIIIVAVAAMILILGGMVFKLSSDIWLASFGAIAAFGLGSQIVKMVHESWLWHFGYSPSWTEVQM